MLLEGIFLPLTTPFYPDGRVYLRKLESNVGRYSLTPAAGMLVLGEVGEGESLTDDETLAALTAAIGAAAREKVMIAAVGRQSVYATLKLAVAAAEAGYDAVTVRAPESCMDDSLEIELMTYFRAVADGSPLPVVLDDQQGRSIRDEFLIELAEHPQVIGAVSHRADKGWVEAVKRQTAKLSREVTVTAVFAAATRRMLSAAASKSNLGGVAVLEASTVKTRTKKVGFQLLSSSTAGMLESWQGGASGGVPRLGACAPQACCEVWQAFKDGDAALAEEKQDRVKRIAALVEGGKGIGAIKYGCDFNGYFGGRPRLPLLGLTAAEMVEVEHLLIGMRN